jgi:predicted nucleotidyltransferase
MTPKKIEEIVSLFADQAKQVYGSRLREVILYGSCARGDFAPDSDIDVMVLLDVPQESINEERKKILDASDRLDMDYDVVLTPVFQSKQMFERYLPASKFYQNVRAEGVRYA